MKFISYVGNSDVPYPYVIGKNNTYFMLNKEYLPNTILNLEDDAYGQLYCFGCDKNQKKLIENSKKKFKIKMILSKVIKK